MALLMRAGAAPGGFHSEAVASHLTLLRQAPGLELLEVSLAELPASVAR